MSQTTTPLITGKLDPCWSCNTKTKDCYKGCECAKCIFPDSYSLWKTKSPDEYEYWLEKHGLVFHYIEQKIKDFDNLYKEYWMRQNKTFADLKTISKDWFIADRKVVNGEWVFVVPEGYIEVTPYFDRIGKTFEYNHCQLCGQKIKRVFYIRNNKKKIVIKIGGVCISKFKRVDKLTKIIKMEIRKGIRKDFKLIYPKLMNECWSNTNFHNGRINPKTNKPAIIKTVLKFWIKLKKIKNVNKLTSQKIMKIIKESEELGFITTVRDTTKEGDCKE